MYTNFFVTVYLKVIILFYLINSFLFIIVFFVGSHGINACVLEERDSKVRLQETPGNWYIWSQFFLIRNRQFFTGTDCFFRRNSFIVPKNSEIISPRYLAGAQNNLCQKEISQISYQSTICIAYYN